MICASLTLIVASSTCSIKCVGTPIASAIWKDLTAQAIIAFAFPGIVSGDRPTSKTE